MMSAIQRNRRQNGNAALPESEEESIGLINAEEGTPSMNANNESEGRPNRRFSRSTIMAAIQRRRQNGNNDDLPASVVAAIQRRRQNNNNNNASAPSSDEDSRGLLGPDEGTSDADRDERRPRRRLDRSARRLRMAKLAAGGAVAIAVAWYFLPRIFFTRIMMALSVRLVIQLVMSKCRGGGGRRRRRLLFGNQEGDSEVELPPTNQQQAGSEDKQDLELGTDSGMTANLSDDTSDEGRSLSRSPTRSTPAAIIPHSSMIHDNSQTFQVHDRSIADPYGKKGTYTGALSKATQLPHGFGRMDYGEGHLYVGDWVHGNWTGKGQLSDADGGHYDGELQNGHKHGQGTMRFADGRVFEGRYVKGIMSEGKMTNPDGSILSIEDVE